jgi:hypothetical protein
LSIVRVELDIGISNDEFERLYQEVQTRFNKVDLPDGTLTAFLDDFSSSDFLPVIEVILDLLALSAKELDQVLGGL